MFTKRLTKFETTWTRKRWHQRQKRELEMVAELYSHKRLYAKFEQQQKFENAITQLRTTDE